MPFLIASIPYINCWVRSEYLRNLEAPIADHPFVGGKAVAVISRQSDSLRFLVAMSAPYAGCCFTLPIEALTVKRNTTKFTAQVVQPYDCFAEQIGICEIEALRRMPLSANGVPATYLFTIASMGTGVADDPEQNKLLHIVTLDETGAVGAYPNNRVRFNDEAMFGKLTEEPKFKTLDHEFRAEVGTMAKPNGHDYSWAQGMEISHGGERRVVFP